MYECAVPVQRYVKVTGGMIAVNGSLCMSGGRGGYYNMITTALHLLIRE